jgi:membrane protease YdiL (CAAX protease family)
VVRCLPAWGLLASSVFFALLHVGPGRQYLPWTLAALLAGATFGSLTLWRGGILAALVAHFVVNAVQLPRYARGLGPQSEVGQGTE